MSKNDFHDLAAFMRSATRLMADEYERIRMRAGDDPGTAGDQGEENWAQLLRDWLPPNFHVVTKGRILGRTGITSPQVDVIVLVPEYPNRLLTVKHYLADGVLAAFECKLTLRPIHIKEWMQNSVQIEKCLLPAAGTPFKELQSPILYGLLAHSHCWTLPTSNPSKVIERALEDHNNSAIIHPRQLPDWLCVADLGCWSSAKIVEYHDAQKHRSPSPPGNLSSGVYVNTGYVGHYYNPYEVHEHFTPVGAFISSLLRRLGWRHRALRDLADYFSDTRLGGLGLGSLWMKPASTLLSEDVLAEISNGKLDSTDLWSEWCGGVT